MRNPLKRQPSADPKRTLRERFAATKAKAGIALRRTRPEPEAETGSDLNDRTALVCYSTWLGIEQRRVCLELYPHLGPKGTAFSVGFNAGEEWHFNGSNRTGGLKDRGPVLHRAVRLLDTLGVDWRGDIARGRGPDDIARNLTTDTGERPPMPRGWPATDAALVTAAGDAERIEAAILALVTGDDRDMDEIPGYSELDEACDEVQATLVRERATSLVGLRAKASGFDLPSQKGHDRWLAKLGASIARDLLHGTNRLVQPSPDPVFEAIEATKRLSAARSAALHLDQLPGNVDPPEQAATREAFFAHVDDVLLVTVPRTAAGCAALCRYALAYHAEHGCALDESWDNNHHFRILDLIARSPRL